MLPAFNREHSNVPTVPHSIPFLFMSFRARRRNDLPTILFLSIVSALFWPRRHVRPHHRSNTP